MQTEQAKRLAAFIVSERKRKKVSLEKLAWKADLTVTAIHNLERGRRRDPRLSTLVKLSKGLGISFSALARAIE